ncbi:MAG: TIGR03915 family putative DNA repair protein [Pseudomonadota bacterium]
MREQRFDGSFAGWRKAARQLLNRGVAPHAVSWLGADSQGGLFDGADGASEAQSPTGALRIPKELPALLESAARFRAEDRWALLYRILWRVALGERAAMLAGDRDGSELHRRIKAVRREAHHMHAFLRFRARDPAVGPPAFVAWHVPAHDILESAVGHFAERMGNASWLIATPDGAALWDGRELRVLSPCPPALADLARSQEDPGEALWLAYYSSTFNPARLNRRVLQTHMPVRFWKDLPEGPLIPHLMSQARAGAQRDGQAQAVGLQPGRQVLIASDKAQPQRAAATELQQCRRCDLWARATQAIPGEGPPAARILLLAGQPGDHEDLSGRPFEGATGQLLEQALTLAGLQRATLYLTYAVKHFKAVDGMGLRSAGQARQSLNPSPEERRACSHWLSRELAQIQPRVVIALGQVALLAARERADSPREAFTLIAAEDPQALLRADPEQRQPLFEALVTALRLARTIDEQVHPPIR